MRLVAKVCFLGLLLVPVTGCWSSYEVNKLAIITLIGIDLDDAGNFKINALVVLPKSSSAGKAEGGKMESSAVIASSTGTSLYDSLRKLSSVLPKKVYWSHLQAIIIGEEVAKQKMVQALDVMKRQHEFRENIDVLVSRGKAEQIVGTKPHLQGSLGAEVSGIIRFSQQTAMTLVTDLNHFTQDISGDTKDHITGGINPFTEKDVEIKKDNKPAPAVSIWGTAVFKQNRLVGWMNREETRGVLFLRNKAKGGIMELPCPKSKSDSVSLQFTKVEAQKVPRMVNGKPEMDVIIHVNADIDEITCSDLQLNSSQIMELNGSLEKEIKANIENALQKGQKEWATDIFQFGDVIYKKYPRVWNKLEPNWRKDGLKNMKVHVKVTANIGRFGLITDPLSVDGKR